MSLPSMHTALAAKSGANSTTTENSERDLWLKHPETQKYIEQLRSKRQDILKLAEAEACKGNVSSSLILLQQSKTLDNIITITLA